MGKMVKNMIYFVVLLLVVLLSFAVSRQAILFPNRDASWSLIRDVYFQPYFMLYGEVFADDIDPPCGETTDMAPCVTGSSLFKYSILSRYCLFLTAEASKIYPTCRDLVPFCTASFGVFLTADPLLLIWRLDERFS